MDEKVTIVTIVEGEIRFLIKKQTKELELQEWRDVQDKVTGEIRKEWKFVGYFYNFMPMLKSVIHLAAMREIRQHETMKLAEYLEVFARKDAELIDLLNEISRSLVQR